MTYEYTTAGTRVSPADLHELVTAIFDAAGMRHGDADLLTGTLVAADLGGIHSHCVLRVPEYVKKLTTEGVDAEGRPRVVSDRGSAIVVDGGNPMGQIGSIFAICALLLPVGGYKGAALAMIFGILSSMLSGAAYGTELVRKAQGMLRQMRFSRIYMLALTESPEASLFWTALGTNPTASSIIS